MKRTLKVLSLIIQIFALFCAFIFGVAAVNQNDKVKECLSAMNSVKIDNDTTMEIYLDRSRRLKADYEEAESVLGYDFIALAVAIGAFVLAAIMWLLADIAQKKQIRDMPLKSPAGASR